MDPPSPNDQIQFVFDGTAAMDALLDATFKGLRAWGSVIDPLPNSTVDGRLNTDDMTAYLSGMPPQTLAPKRSSPRQADERFPI